MSQPGLQENPLHGSSNVEMQSGKGSRDLNKLNDELDLEASKKGGAEAPVARQRRASSTIKRDDMKAQMKSKDEDREKDALEGLVRTGTILNFGIASTAFVMICLLGGGMYTGVTTTASIGGLVTAVLVALTCTVTHMCFMWVSADIKNEVQFGDNGGAGNSKDEEGDGSGTLPTWGTSGLQKVFIMQIFLVFMGFLFGGSLFFMPTTSLRPKIASLQRNDPDRWELISAGNDVDQVYTIVNTLFRLSGVALFFLSIFVIPCMMRQIVKLVTLLDIIEGLLETLSAMYMVGGLALMMLAVGSLQILTQQSCAMPEILESASLFVWFIFAVGILIVLISIFGIYSSVKENGRFLKIYCYLLYTMTVLLLVFAFVLYFAVDVQDNVHNYCVPILQFMKRDWFVKGTSLECDKYTGFAEQYSNGTVKKVQGTGEKVQCDDKQYEVVAWEDEDAGRNTLFGCLDPACCETLIDSFNTNKGFIFLFGFILTTLLLAGARLASLEAGFAADEDAPNVMKHPDVKWLVLGALLFIVVACIGLVASWPQPPDCPDPRLAQGNYPVTVSDTNTSATQGVSEDRMDPSGGNSSADGKEGRDGPGGQAIVAKLNQSVIDASDCLRLRAGLVVDVDVPPTTDTTDNDMPGMLTAGMSIGYFGGCCQMSFNNTRKYTGWTAPSGGKASPDPDADDEDDGSSGAPMTAVAKRQANGCAGGFWNANAKLLSSTGYCESALRVNIVDTQGAVVDACHAVVVTASLLYADDNSSAVPGAEVDEDTWLVGDTTAASRNGRASFGSLSAIKASSGRDFKLLFTMATNTSDVTTTSGAFKVGPAKASRLDGLRAPTRVVKNNEFKAYATLVDTYGNQAAGVELDPAANQTILVVDWNASFVSSSSDESPFDSSSAVVSTDITNGDVTLTAKFKPGTGSTGTTDGMYVLRLDSKYPSVRSGNVSVVGSGENTEKLDLVVQPSGPTSTPGGSGGTADVRAGDVINFKVQLQDAAGTFLSSDVESTIAVMVPNSSTHVLTTCTNPTDCSLIGDDYTGTDNGAWTATDATDCDNGAWIAQGTRCNFTLSDAVLESAKADDGVISPNQLQVIIKAAGDYVLRFGFPGQLRQGFTVESNEFTVVAGEGSRLNIIDQPLAMENAAITSKAQVLDRFDNRVLTVSDARLTESKVFKKIDNTDSTYSGGTDPTVDAAGEISWTITPQGTTGLVSGSSYYLRFQVSVSLGVTFALTQDSWTFAYDGAAKNAQLSTAITAPILMGKPMANFTVTMFSDVAASTPYTSAGSNDKVVLYNSQGSQSDLGCADPTTGAKIDSKDCLTSDPPSPGTGNVTFSNVIIYKPSTSYSFKFTHLEGSTPKATFDSTDSFAVMAGASQQLASMQLVQWYDSDYFPFTGGSKCKAYLNVFELRRGDESDPGSDPENGNCRMVVELTASGDATLDAPNVCDHFTCPGSKGDVGGDEDGDGDADVEVSPASIKLSGSMDQINKAIQSIELCPTCAVPTYSITARASVDPTCGKVMAAACLPGTPCCGRGSGSPCVCESGYTGANCELAQSCPTTMCQMSASETTLVVSAKALQQSVQGRLSGFDIGGCPVNPDNNSTSCPPVGNVTVMAKVGSCDAVYDVSDSQGGYELTIPYTGPDHNTTISLHYVAASDRPMSAEAPSAPELTSETFELFDNAMAGCYARGKFLCNAAELNTLPHGNSRPCSWAFYNKRSRDVAVCEGCGGNFGAVGGADCPIAGVRSSPNPSPSAKPAYCCSGGRVPVSRQVRLLAKSMPGDEKVVDSLKNLGDMMMFASGLQPGTVKGTVSDGITGLGVQDARVELFSGAVDDPADVDRAVMEAVQKTMSDSEGGYNFTNVDPGIFSVVITPVADVPAGSDGSRSDADRGLPEKQDGKEKKASSADDGSKIEPREKEKAEAEAEKAEADGNKDSTNPKMPVVSLADCTYYCIKQGVKGDQIFKDGSYRGNGNQMSCGQGCQMRLRGANKKQCDKTCIDTSGSDTCRRLGPDGWTYFLCDTASETVDEKDPVGNCKTGCKVSSFTQAFDPLAAHVTYNTTTADFAVNPKLAFGSYRIVMTWTTVDGTAPTDLDMELHFATGNSRTANKTDNNTHSCAVRGGETQCGGARLIKRGIATPDSPGVEVIEVDQLFVTDYHLYVRNFDRTRPTERSDASIEVYGSTGLIQKFFMPVSGSEESYENPWPTMDYSTNVTSDPLATAAQGNFTAASEVARVFCVHVADPLAPAQIHDCGRFFSFWAAFNAQKSIACPPTDEDCRGKQVGHHCSETVPGSYFYCPPALASGVKPEARYQGGGGLATLNDFGMGDAPPGVAKQCFKVEQELTPDGCNVMDTTVNAKVSPVVPADLSTTTVCQGANKAGLPGAATWGESGCTAEKKCADKWLWAGEEHTGCKSGGKNGKFYHTPICGYENRDENNVQQAMDYHFCQDNSHPLTPGKYYKDSCTWIEANWGPSKCVSKPDSKCMNKDYVYIAREWGVCDTPRCRNTNEVHNDVDANNGAENKQQCYLPFTHNGLTHTDCKNDKKGSWCATAPEFKLKSTLTSYWEKKTAYKMCQFPFSYWWKSQYSCVSRWWKPGKWCATRKWWWGGVRQWSKCKADGVTSQTSYSKWTKKTVAVPGYGWGRCAPGGSVQ